MPAAVYLGDGEIEVRELDVPELGPQQALVEVSHCGICGTDLHLVLEQYARPGLACSATSGRARSPRSAPTCSGWEIGARVVQNPTPGCGECRACRTRPPVGVPAARAARPPRLHARRVLPLQGRARVAPAARPRHALDARGRAHRADRDRDPHGEPRRASTPDDRVLVTGGGPVGLLTTAVLRARGIDDITVSEPAPLRRERALAVGAARAIEPDELPRAPMGRPVAEPYTIAFECSGNARGRGVGVRPARLRGHARVRRHRPRDAARSTTTARSCSS